MSLLCDPLSFMHWAVTVPLKLWWPIMKHLKLSKEINVAFSEWAQGLLKKGMYQYMEELVLYEGRTAAASLWNIKNGS